jgi:hypothetical protein
MSKVITYQNTDKQCFCQIKFGSGERVLISILDKMGSVPSLPFVNVKLFRLAMGGLLPRETLWECFRERGALYLLGCDARSVAQV